jgi:hypothetical protein
MKINKKISIFLIFIIAGLISLVYLNENEEIPEEETKDLTILFDKVDSNLDKIYCFTLSLPIKNFLELDLKKTNTGVLKNALNKVVICDGIVKGETFPIYWGLNIKNLEGTALLSRAFYSHSEDLIISNVYYQKTQNIAYASSSSKLFPVEDKFGFFNGEYIVKKVTNQNILNEIPLCEFCNEMPRNNAHFFVEQLGVEAESNISTVITSLWDSREKFKQCGEKIGLNQGFFENKGIKINNSNHLLGSFIWSNYLIDGWKSKDAEAIFTISDCEYNEANKEWFCNKDEKGMPIILLNKGERCNSTKDLYAQNLCYLYYFSSNEYTKNNNDCMEMKFLNFGKKEPLIKMELPTARGLLITQRTLVLDKNIWSTVKTMEVVQPIKNEKNQLIPCKIKFENNTVTRRVSKDKLLTFHEKRYLNIDFKPECEKAKKEFVDLKTIYLGIKND